MFEENNYNEDDSSKIKLGRDEEMSAQVRSRRWTNRRRMSWISLTYLIFSSTAPFLMDINEAYIPLITNSQFLFFGIIASYIGGNVIEQIKIK
tara:strand:- start:952 stop:1230 length:279 start_codon:yes stop_codon:yes gene_type:complete